MEGLRRVNQYSYEADSRYLHRVVELIYRARTYFKAKMYDCSDLVLHIPLPLQAVLMQSLTVLDGFPVVTKHYNITKIYNIKVLPAYENRIVMCAPEWAIYDNEPMAIIEFDRDNFPLYYEFEK